jgi:lysophospholipase L1-like esterase
MKSFLLTLLLFSTVCSAQQTAPASTAAQKLEQWKQSRATLYMNDFGELGRYREANRALAAPAANEGRVVFFGDSITDGWKIAQWFPGKPYVNRGISGQTTSQMLVRFRQDVLDLHPKAVVILAGTNDIAGNTGPITLEDIEANLASMAQLANANHIAVVMSSVTPVNDYTERSQDFFSTRPPAKIVELNRWMKDYCAKNGYVYLDYFSAMVNKDGLLKRELAEDGLHPKDAGYALMVPMASAAIEKALSTR